MSDDLKHVVLNNGCYNRYVEFRKFNFFRHVCPDFDSDERFQTSLSALFLYDDDEIKEASRVYKNKNSRCSRLKKRINKFYSRGYPFFLTLTFNDSTLDKNSDKSLRQMVSRFLSSLDCFFIANQDFGGQFGRQHYHAFIVCETDSPDLSAWSKRGFYKLESFGSSDSDSVKVAKYIAKASNHALKETALRSRCIYSRKKPSWY